MPRAAKVTVSLPTALLRAADQERRQRKETRSQFFRSALESALKQRRRGEAVERYVRGYREEPETEAEVSSVDRASRAALAREPW